MKKYKGSCHCGAVQFEVDLDLKDAISCNCSICGKKGSLLAFAQESQFKLISGENFLTDYQFGKKTIHHPFCSKCGISSFGYGVTPNGMNRRAINIRCLDEIDLKSIPIREFDGKSL